ncbi:hypothetical protein [Kytococcus sedentarius]|uniref:hypothetical protein n=1 Tax=Kytococcus sedentarius TaxID=1276 RepID=UPI0035BBF906
MEDTATPVNPALGKGLAVLAALGTVIAVAGLVLHGALVETSMALLWVPLVLIAAGAALACGLWFRRAGSTGAFMAFALTAMPLALVGTVVGALLGIQALLD